MRVVNRVEQDILQTQLEEWFRHELQACNDVASLLQSNNTYVGATAAEFVDVQTTLSTYCESCNKERRTYSA